MLAALLTVAPALAASAHDELLFSSPESGERLESAPSEVDLRFSADVLTIGAAVIVIDAAGRDWTVAEPDIEGGIVRVALEEGMPDAGYELRWRVVSSDGHPISGLVPFTIGDGAPLARTVAPTPEAAEAGTDTYGSVGEESGQSSQEGAAVWRTVLIGAAGAAIALVLVVLVPHLGRRAAGTDDTDADASARASNTGKAHS